MNTTLITRDMIINDIIKAYPQTITVFNRFKVDSCCGGGQRIELTATDDGVDVDALMEALNQATEVHSQVSEVRKK